MHIRSIYPETARYHHDHKPGIVFVYYIIWKIYNIPATHDVRVFIIAIFFFLLLLSRDRSHIYTAAVSLHHERGSRPRRRRDWNGRRRGGKRAAELLLPPRRFIYSATASRECFYYNTRRACVIQAQGLRGQIQTIRRTCRVCVRKERARLHANHAPPCRSARNRCRARCTGVFPHRVLARFLILDRYNIIIYE